MTPQLDPELMLRHARGLRALVQALVIDDSRVDDVLQETWLRALERPPHSAAALGTWLRRVASRVALRTSGRDADRARREERAAVDGFAPSASEIVDREMARRRVVDAVFELREPYRSTILLRYFQNVETRQIAVKLDLPVETVRTRIKRGLAQLRGRLDAGAGGDPHRWHAALLPIASLPVASPGEAIGLGSALAARLALVLCLAALGLAAHLLWPGREAAERPPTVAFSDLELEPLETALVAPDREAPERRVSEPFGEGAGQSSSAEKTPARARLVVEGRVVGPAGTPLPHARVSLRLWHGAAFDWNRVARPLTTTASGRFRFEGPAYDETAFSLGVTHPELAARTSTHRWHAKEGPIDVGDIALEPGGVVRGRLIDEETGAPIGGARVSLLGSLHARLESQIEASLTNGVRTDEAGAFALPRVPPGTWVIRAQAADFVPAVTTLFRAGTGKDVDLEPLALARGLVLSGIVHDGNGRALRGASVRAHARHTWPPPRAQSDASGRFELRGLPPGKLRLTVTHWRHATQHRAIEDVAATPWLEIELAARGALGGRVVDASTGEPIEVFALEARDAGARSARAGGEATSDERAARRARVEDYLAARLAGGGAMPRHAGRPRTHPGGAFGLRSLQPGEHVVDVFAPGYVQTTAGPFTVTAGGRAEAVIALERGRALRGRVVDEETGRPLPGAKIDLWLPDPDGASTDETRPGWLVDRETADTDGCFDLGRYRPGPFRISASYPGRVTRIADVKLSLADDAEATLALTHGACVRGRVRGWAPGDRAQVVLTHESGARYTAPVDAETGAYEIDGLRAGAYRTRVREEADALLPPRANADGFDLVVAPQARVRHDVTRNAEPGSVIGRIAAAADDDPAGLRVRLRRSTGEDGPNAFGTGADLFGDVDQNGSFEIDRVVPGSYRLEVYRLGAPPVHQETIWVEVGEEVQVDIQL